MELDVPLQFFMTASDEMLDNFALKRLEHGANLEKEARAILDEAKRVKEAARIAQWLKENRRELLRTVGAHLPDAKAEAA